MPNQIDAPEVKVGGEDTVIVRCDFTHLEEVAEALRKLDPRIDIILVYGTTVWYLRDAYGSGLFNERFRIQVGFNETKQKLIVVRAFNSDLRVGDTYKVPS